MITPILIALISIGFTTASNRICTDRQACIKDTDQSCYIKDDCNCPAGYDVISICDPRISCHGRCPPIFDTLSICIPSDFCSGEYEERSKLFCVDTLTVSCSCIDGRVNDDGECVNMKLRRLLYFFGALAFSIFCWFCKICIFYEKQHKRETV